MERFKKNAPPVWSAKTDTASKEALFSMSDSPIQLVSSGIPNLLPSRDRSPGLHHSEVLYDWLVRMGHYSKSKGTKENDSTMSRMQLGLAFEDILCDRYSKHYPDRYIRPGELSIDGLPITLDLLDTHHYGPDSIKLTWLSARHEISSEKFIYHWAQLKSECIALNCNTARLHICHINGDYTYGDQSVIFNKWERKFSKHELDNHKTRILRHRDRMEKERREAGLG